MEFPPEARLLRRIIQDKNLNELFNAGFDPSLLRPPYNQIFDRLIDFYRKYRDVPSARRLQEICKDLGPVIIADAAPSKAGVYWDQIVVGQLDGELQTTIEEILRASSLHEQPFKILDMMRDKARDLAIKYQSSAAQVTYPGDWAPSIWNEYQQACDGNMPGIPVDPKFINLTASLGRWSPGNITTVISRSGVGKTWFVMMQLLHAAHMGYRGILASMEMTEFEISQRLVALDYLLNYDKVVKGHLLGDQEKKLQEGLAAMQNREGHWANIRLMAPVAIRDVDAVEGQADVFQAHIVVADAFYDYEGKARGKRDKKDWERIDENLHIVRRLSLATGRHWFLTAQFNRLADQPYTSDEFAVGGSDTFNKISNNVVYLIQSKSLKRQSKVIVQLGKGRKASPQPPMIHNWNYIDMDQRAIQAYVVQDRNRDNKKYA